MTHIHAYQEEVTKKQQAVTTAKAALKEAEDALKSHPDYKDFRSAVNGEYITKKQAEGSPETTVKESPKPRTRDSKGHFLKSK